MADGHQKSPRCKLSAQEQFQYPSEVVKEVVVECDLSFVGYVIRKLHLCIVSGKLGMLLFLAVGPRGLLHIRLRVSHGQVPALNDSNSRSCASALLGLNNAHMWSTDRLRSRNVIRIRGDRRRNSVTVERVLPTRFAVCACCKPHSSDESLITWRHFNRVTLLPLRIPYEHHLEHLFRVGDANERWYGAQAYA